MDKTIIKSSTGSYGPIIGSNNTLGSFAQITGVTFDTKGLKDVTVNLTFTAQIASPADATANLLFVVKKSADKGGEMPVGSTYSYINTASVLESETFSFQVTDYCVDPGKYTYNIQLDPNSSVSDDGIIITNGTLTLTATGKSDK